MTKFDYRRLLNSAKRLIDRFGAKIDIVASDVTPNPSEPWKAGTAAPKGETAIGVFLDYEQKFIDGTVIQQGDMKVLMSASGLTFPPDFVGHLLRYFEAGGTEKWTIVKIKPLNPGDTMIIYTVQVRQ